VYPDFRHLQHSYVFFQQDSGWMLFHFATFNNNKVCVRKTLMLLHFMMSHHCIHAYIRVFAILNILLLSEALRPHTVYIRVVTWYVCRGPALWSIDATMSYEKHSEMSHHEYTYINITLNIHIVTFRGIYTPRISVLWHPWCIWYLLWHLTFVMRASILFFFVFIYCTPCVVSFFLPLTVYIIQSAPSCMCVQ